MVKMTIHPGFPGQSQSLMRCSGKKSQFFRDAHLSRFWLGVPDLSQFAQLCSRMLTHKWPKITWELTTVTQTPMSDPRFAPYDLSRGIATSALIQNCGVQIMVVLTKV